LTLLSGPQKLEDSPQVYSPAIQTETRELRLLGTSSTMLEPILSRASKELGIKLHVKILDGTDAHRAAIIAPDAFDIYDQWFHSIEPLWIARSIQPIDIERIKFWSDVGELATHGLLGGASKTAPGTPPNRILFVQESGRLGPQLTSHISMLPLTHCADSFAYNIEDLPSEFNHETESWSWLFDRRFGRAAIQNNPSIGVIDAILAASSDGSFKCRDPGNLTLNEIDMLFTRLGNLKQAGHFSGFWGTPKDLSEMLARGRTKIFSFWSSTKPLLNSAKQKIRIAVPKEGYRGWFGGLAISRQCQGRQLDLAYEYLNWWLDGWAAIAMARQGYYFSSPARAKAVMDSDEWDYWYGGKPASRTLPSNNEAPAALQGESREGGTYERRMSQIAIWNTVMDEHNYLTRRWNDFTRPRR
jgi:putative spermidine/putrescine transport system substrate-binding protein